MRILAILSMLLLGGCETFLANAIQDYNDTRGAVRGYIGDNFDDRRWIREECREGLKMRTTALRAEDKHEEADALLASRYPPVITAKGIDEGRVPADELNKAHICGEGEDGNANTE